jgi:hypothetical protein
MQPLNLQSEKFSATGNLVSHGLLNAMGRPQHSLQKILLRETVQNSWDARSSDEDPVSFSIKGWTATTAQMDFLKKVIFVEKPKKFDDLEKVIEHDDHIDFLVVSDRGTTGLGGPTRADKISNITGPQDFVDFLRNIGQSTDRKYHGGTYGYGKAALYLSSSIRTICVDTCTSHENKPQRRFIVSAMGEKFTIGKGEYSGNYTGRHWWGRISDDEIVEPALNSDAEKIASELGLPGFTSNEFGTNILILCPKFQDLDHDALMKSLAECIPWYFWPKFIPDKNGIVPMKFELQWENELVPIPDPYKMPVVRKFIESYENYQRMEKTLSDNSENGVHKIECKKPKKHLGKLSLIRFPAEARDIHINTETDSDIPFTGQTHHIALMRQPRLILKYHSGPPLPDDMVGYAGVFIVDDEVDRIFARAEPPSHDDWIKTLLEGTERTYVSTYLIRITEVLRQFTDPPPIVSGDEQQQIPMGQFSQFLAPLLPGVGNSSQKMIPRNESSLGVSPTDGRYTGKSRQERALRKSRHKESPKSIKIKILESPEVINLEGKRTAVIKFDFDKIPSCVGYKIEIDSAVILDGNSIEKEPPAGSEVPYLIGWKKADDRDWIKEKEIFIPSDQKGPWHIAVSITRDILTNISVTGEAEFTK